MRQIIGVSMVTSVSRNYCYTLVLNLLSFVLTLKNKLEREESVCGKAVVVNPDISTTIVFTKNVALAFQIHAFPCEICYPLPKTWTFLQGLCISLQHIFYFLLWLPGKSGKCRWTGNITLFSQVALGNLGIFRINRMKRCKNWKPSLHTWSTVCCLHRACSRANRFWFRDSWSDCIAAAAEASTRLFNSSPSSWRTISESCAVFISARRSCGNTMNKDFE